MSLKINEKIIEELVISYIKHSEYTEISNSGLYYISKNNLWQGIIKHHRNFKNINMNKLKIIYNKKYDIMNEQLKNNIIKNGITKSIKNHNRNKILFIQEDGIYGLYYMLLKLYNIDVSIYSKIFRQISKI